MGGLVEIGVWVLLWRQIGGNEGSGVDLGRIQDCSYHSGTGKNDCMSMSLDLALLTD